MLITKHFVLVHQPKTGGVFIKNLCLAHKPDWIVRIDEEHPPARDIPREFRGLPVLGFVRNPWDWYVSWYHYVRASGERFQGSPPVSPWVAMFDEGRASFRQMIIAACSGIPSNDGPRPWWMDRIRKTGVDHYSHSCVNMFEEGFGGTVEMGRFEKIRDDFIAFLQRHAIPVGDEFIGHVRTRRPDNVTPHAPYSSYYDPELRDLVGTTSRIAAEYGYTFG